MTRIKERTHVKQMTGSKVSDHLVMDGKKCFNRFKLMSWGRDVSSWCNGVLTTEAFILIQTRCFFTTVPFHFANTNSGVSMKTVNLIPHICLHIKEVSNSTVKKWNIFQWKWNNFWGLFLWKSTGMCDPFLRIKPIVNRFPHICFYKQLMVSMLVLIMSKCVFKWKICDFSKIYIYI